jgi:hypothetical protein
VLHRNSKSIHCGIEKGLQPIEVTALESLIGAEGETRTPTDIHPLDPEPSASTNSATSATGMNMVLEWRFVKTFL